MRVLSLFILCEEAQSRYLDTIRKRNAVRLCRMRARNMSPPAGGDWGVEIPLVSSQPRSFDER